MGILHLFLAVGMTWAASPTDTVTNTVTRTYLIDGMTCSSCVNSVTDALKSAGLKPEQIKEVSLTSKERKLKLGHATITLPAGEYQGISTDCKLIKAIGDKAGYDAFIDVKNRKPCS